ncbi:RRP15-like protein, partial [Linum perenne]
LIWYQTYIFDISPLNPNASGFSPTANYLCFSDTGDQVSPISIRRCTFRSRAFSFNRMAEVAPQVQETGNATNKRKSGRNKGGKARKKPKQFSGTGDRVKKIDPKLKKFLRKKARDYNSDSDEEDDGDYMEEKRGPKVVEDDDADQVSEDDLNNDEVEEKADGSGSENDEYDVGTILPGITKLSEGCRAFRVAFQSIIKKKVSDNPLGPVLSEHKKLVAEKLAEENEERKAKGDSKKEKKLVAEKGHLKPANYLDTHEKFLISVATKGVVKLFNAVNKAQLAQKGLNPLRSKDAKVINKRRKQAFFSEIRKPSSTDSKADGAAPSWAPLRDNYMLTNPSLKDWDKNPESASISDGRGKMSDDSSSDED